MAGVEPERRWADLPIKAERRLVELLCAQSVPIQGRGPVRGGVRHRRRCRLGGRQPGHDGEPPLPWSLPGGELLDVDGVTGGFNFQACWSGGWLAGQAIAAVLTGSDQTR